MTDERGDGCDRPQGCGGPASPEAGDCLVTLTFASGLVFGTHVQFTSHSVRRRRSDPRRRSRAV